MISLTGSFAIDSVLDQEGQSSLSQVSWDISWVLWVREPALCFSAQLFHSRADSHLVDLQGFPWWFPKMALLWSVSTVWCSNYDLYSQSERSWASLVLAFRDILTINQCLSRFSTLGFNPIKDLKGVERNLQTEARNADLLMIWTDCDREGEHIGSEIMKVCRKVNARLIVKRARFSAIIAGWVIPAKRQVSFSKLKLIDWSYASISQIKQACLNPVELDMKQADAVDARMALDLRLGAAFTRMQTTRLQARFGQLAENVISYGESTSPRPFASHDLLHLKLLLTCALFATGIFSNQYHQVHANFQPSVL